MEFILNFAAKLSNLLGPPLSFPDNGRPFLIASAIISGVWNTALQCCQSASGGLVPIDWLESWPPVS